MSMPSRQKEGSTIIIISIVARRRADIVGFVNGLPLLFMEVKNLHKCLQSAHDENLSDYRDTIPHLFHHNAITILGNGHKAVVGAYSTAFKFFREWKRLEEDEKGVVDMVTLLKGVCTKANFLDLVENFILFDDSAGETVKIVAQNQQFLGVKQSRDGCAQPPRPWREARRVLAHPGRRQVVLNGVLRAESSPQTRRQLHLPRPDRPRRSGQPDLHDVCAGLASSMRTMTCRARAATTCKSKLLDQHAAYVFSLIQKFNNRPSPRESLTQTACRHHRHDRRGPSDPVRHARPQHAPGAAERQLHRLHWHAADEAEMRSQARCSAATSPNTTSSAPWKMVRRCRSITTLAARSSTSPTAELNERIAEKLEQFEAERSDRDVAERLEQELKREYHIITSD